MAKFVKVYKDSIPELSLVGKVYRNEDRDSSGTFSGKWEEWFGSGTFDRLELVGAAHKDTGHVGAMRMNGNTFEYWLGMLFDSTADIPSEFSSVVIPASEVGIAWIKGEDNAELYSKHEDCLREFAERDMVPSEKAWYIEDYVCPRFTTPDENGEVILDYMITLN